MFKKKLKHPIQAGHIARSAENSDEPILQKGAHSAKGPIAQGDKGVRRRSSLGENSGKNQSEKAHYQGQTLTPPGRQLEVPLQQSVCQHVTPPEEQQTKQERRGLH
jgi:hypothetical protein